ncbi:GNAT family N-acetyltransferase [Kitasatospora sp. NBC_00374]|uniref:GNAT family N-acetyltransferase n=1 Tax=Kitasatospora sp. NBC_00374 TaxID=2975964 RepID=UPI0030E17FC7
MLFRSTVEADLDRFLPLVTVDPASGMTPEKYRENLADRQYRPERTWIAEDGAGTVLALAVWWGGSDEERPAALDGLFVHPSLGTGEERTDLAARLLGAAHTAFAATGPNAPPEYHVFLPGDWHERPEAVAALTWRREAARRAGLPAELERLRYAWTPQDARPEPARLLAFEPEPDDGVFVGLFHRTLAGSLDSHSLKEAAELGAEAQARADVEFYRTFMRGERSWWRVARDADGEVVGFGLPSRNHAFPVIGYLGVLPEYRGRGYVGEILGEITRILLAEAAPEEIRADTDLGNVPMAAAFERAGYRNFARRLVFSAT